MTSQSTMKSESEKSSASNEMNYYKASMFCQMLSFSIVSLIPVFWSEVLKYSPQTIAYINGFAMAIPLIAPLLFGTLGSMVSPVRPIVVCYLLYAAAALGMYFFHDILSQTLLCTLLQFSRWGFFTLVPVGVLHALGKKAGSEYGSYRRLGSLGFILGLMGTGFLADYYGLSLMLPIIALFGFLAAIPFMIRIQIPVRKKQTMRYMTLLKDKKARLFLLGFLCTNSMFAFCFVFMPVRMKEMGASDSYVSFTISLCGVLALVSLKGIGRLVDHFRPTTLLLILPFTCALRSLLVGFPDSNLFWFPIIQLLHIPTWVLGEILAIAYLKRFCVPESFPRMQALCNASVTAGMAIGSWCVGILLDTGIANLQTSFFITFLYPLCGLFFFYRLYFLVQQEGKTETYPAFQENHVQS